MRMQTMHEHLTIWQIEIQDVSFSYVLSIGLNNSAKHEEILTKDDNENMLEFIQTTQDKWVGKKKKTPKDLTALC